MDDKKLYEQKYQAQLDAWKADVAKLKARASEAEADAQLAMNRHVQTLERKLDEAHNKLGQMRGASGDAWNSVKSGAEAAWASLRLGFHEAAAKFRDKAD